MGSPLRMKIGPSRVFNTYEPIFTRDTKELKDAKYCCVQLALCILVPWCLSGMTPLSATKRDVETTLFSAFRGYERVLARQATSPSKKP
jgi:hypothetical protein